MNANNNGVQILSFPEINTLESFLCRHTKVFGTFQEGCNIEFEYKKLICVITRCLIKLPEIFSMHLKAILLSLIFLTAPGCKQLDNLQSKTPSFKTSKKLSISPEVLMGSLVTILIHSKHSWANSSLYFELI